MAEIQRKLQRLDFPFNSKEALNYLVHCCTSGKPTVQQAIPGLEVVSDNFSFEVCQEFIFFNTNKKGQSKQKLNHVQEMRLIEMICNCLSEAPEKVKQEVFNMIFSEDSRDDKKLLLLTKLISVALSLSQSSVLNCASNWINETGCHSMLVCDAIDKFVLEYCSLFPDSSKVFQTLPTVSISFTCSFITSVTFLFNFKHIKKFPSLALLQSVNHWLTKNNSLCANLSHIHKKAQTGTPSPVSGLVRWTVLGHVASSIHLNKSSELGSQEKFNQTIKVLSQLHISVLLSLQASTQEIQPGFVAADVKQILSDLVEIFRHKDTNREQMFYTILVAIERLAQIIQVAFVAKSLKLMDNDRKDIHKISEGLPPNRLLQIVLRNSENASSVDLMEIS